jgi:hypothetical protein
VSGIWVSLKYLEAVPAQLCALAALLSPTLVQLVPPSLLLPHALSQVQLRVPEPFVVA